MKNSIKLFAAILLMAGFSTAAMAQTSATVAATPAGVKLIVPMTLSETASLHFGTINVLVGAGGTCVLPSNSTIRSFTGGVAAAATAPIATNAAYNVTGTASATYALTLPASFTVTDGTHVMTVNAMKARFNAAGADAVTSALSGAGTDSFTLGGTITVTAAQVAGTYAGTFPVTVDYN